MPTPVPVPCMGNLLGIAQMFGGIVAKAQEPVSTWDQARVSRLRETLVETATNCIFAFDCEPGATSIFDALDKIRDLGEEAGPGMARGQAEELGDAVNAYMSCLFRMFEMAIDPAPNRPVEDFPGLDDSDWYGIVRPNRVKVR